MEDSLWQRFTRHIPSCKKVERARAKKGLPPNKKESPKETFSQHLKDEDSTTSFFSDDMAKSIVRLSNTYRHSKNLQYPSQSILDLHGFTEDEAYETLVQFLMRLQKQGQRKARIITGKSGVLKNMVPKWLKHMPDLVAAFQQASPHKGGDGALDIWLIRK